MMSNSNTETSENLPELILISDLDDSYSVDDDANKDTTVNEHDERVNDGTTQEIGLNLELIDDYANIPILKYKAKESDYCEFAEDLVYFNKRYDNPDFHNVIAWKNNNQNKTITGFITWAESHKKYYDSDTNIDCYESKPIFDIWKELPESIKTKYKLIAIGYNLGLQK